VSAPAQLGQDVAERLYYESAALEFEATVTDVRLHSRAEGEQLWQVSLDRTAFYPEGGGQPWDTGVLTAVARSGAVLEVPVERVEEDERGEVWHTVRKPLVAGTVVTGTVDAERRADHEQQHSGQHLLSAMFWRELGAKTVSFHLGAESSTIDLLLREGVERMSEDELSRVEETANRVVMEGRPLSAHWVQPEMARLMLERGDLRKLPEREGPMRIVQMQGIEFNACGGTHVSNTGAIGAITLRKVERAKKGWRVEFCCGLRAVRAARKDFDLLKQTAGILTVGLGDVPGRVKSLLEKSKGMAKELKRLEKLTLRHHLPMKGEE
jgi:alanyl-tRNA synthetase